MIDLENIATPFKLEMFILETEIQKENQKQASAVKKRSRIIARRARSEEILAEILPPADDWQAPA